MAVDPVFRNDKLEVQVRKCIVFPADGSETRIVHMNARTVIGKDITSYSRSLDMTSAFGDDCRKMRVAAHRSARNGVQSTYLFFYNLSPNLPINLNVAHLIGVTPSHLKIKKRLFWRGDVVAMKVQPESERIDFIIESMDADLLELGSLEEFLRERYQEGVFERLLHNNELEWDFYLSSFCGPSSLLLGPPKSYWGENAAKKEENFLHDLNELRCTIGRPPLPPHVYMKSYSEHAVTLYSAFKSAFGLHQKVTGPPKLPPELERLIFETCAFESPEICTILVLVARRVQVWIDPILIATVCLTEDVDSTSKRKDRLERFLAKLLNGQPVEYYRQHIKNLAILGTFPQNETTIHRILAICTGVENLAPLASARGGFDLFEHPQAAGRSHLRRLSIKLASFNFQPFGSNPNFHHSCFANLTHLHLFDEEYNWPTYAGWEMLTSLTHLAFACAVPADVTRLMQTLPTVQYVAVGHYDNAERHRYADATVNNSLHTRAAWDVRVVLFPEIPQYDWERGARDEGDFWDLVEREVKRRLKDGLVE